MAAVLSWLGVDGSGWNLSTGYEGVHLLQAVSGLGDPEFETYWSDRIGDGDRYRGYRVRRRLVTFSVGVGTDVVGQAWRDLDAAWWRSLDPHRVGLLDVLTESLEHRYLVCRLAQSSGKSYPFDPAVDGVESYLITLAADEPYWRGDDVVETWAFVPGAENFYGGSGGGGFGPPYVISASGAFGEADVTNEGDVPAWPRWKVTGPTSSATLTVDGQTIALPTPIPAFTSRYIHTDPPDVFGDFVESRWDEMTGVQDFAPVPVGATVPVTVNVDGGGTGTSVTMTFTPRYKRAW